MSGAIPLIDIPAQIRPLKSELLKGIEGILDSGRFVQGPHCEAFEESFAMYCGVSHAVCCANGTVALELALRAARIGTGDEVITVSNSFVATGEAIASVGAIPVLVDIDPDGLMDIDAVPAAIGPRTAAVIPVHLDGQVVDLPRLRDVLPAGIVIVADAAQAHGAMFGDAQVASLADVSTFSFYPSKNLATVGEGGAVVTSDPELAERARQLRSHEGVGDVGGSNWRLGEIEALALRVFLPYLEEWNTRRREVAAIYDARLHQVVGIPRSVAGDVYHHYVIRSKDRDALQLALQRAGIETRVHYPVPIHKQPPFDKIARYGPLPACEERVAQILSLPIGPWLSDAEAMRVTKSVVEASS